MRICIILDIEGVTGTVWGAYGLAARGELPYFTRVMTEELNVVVRTLQAEGVDDIVIYEAWSPPREDYRALAKES